MKLKPIWNLLLAGGICVACPTQTLAVSGSGESDSMHVEQLVRQVSTLPANSNKILAYAKGFLDTPYAGGTLETFPFEHLVVRTDSVDCTTFVEYVLALAMTDTASGKSSDTVQDADLTKISAYTSFKRNLQLIRYRGGSIDGYTSRLHYFSDWILDNERKGIVLEVTKASPYAIRRVDLNFMSTHASLYPYLRESRAELLKMQQLELPWKEFQLPYIPKEKLGEGREILHVLDGDILTLVTNIRGLDVVHVGFACWVGEHLHLLHASSAKKKVVLDPLTLYDYCKNKNTQIGIRVVRPLVANH